MIRRFLLRILFNALVLYIVAAVVPGISFKGNWMAFLLAGLVFAVINALIRPILKIISLPFLALTLGLFSIVINMAMLWFLTQVTPDLTIIGFWAYFWGTIIISILNFLINPLFKTKH